MNNTHEPLEPLSFPETVSTFNFIEFGKHNYTLNHTGTMFQNPFNFEKLLLQRKISKTYTGLLGHIRTSIKIYFLNVNLFIFTLLNKTLRENTQQENQLTTTLHLILTLAYYFPMIERTFTMNIQRSLKNLISARNTDQ